MIGRNRLGFGFKIQNEPVPQGRRGYGLNIFEAEAEGVTPDQIIDQVIQTVLPDASAVTA